jgi:hypothetical protein
MPQLLSDGTADRQKSSDLSCNVETVYKNRMKTDKDDERIAERVM